MQLITITHQFMKTTHKLVLYAVCTLVLSLTLASCRIQERVIEENDIVYGSKRITLTLMYHNMDWRSPLYYMQQSIVKELRANQQASYHIYDVLYLTNSSFKHEDKAFIIVDDEPFPVVIDHKELENTKELIPQKPDVMTSDSTTMSVITGYSENNQKITRFSYALPTEAILKIDQANHVSFRYYAGPSMITVTLQAGQLTKFKQLIHKD